DNKVIFHNGWWHGNNAVFIRLIPEDATIIVMGNRYSNAIYKAKQLINIFTHAEMDEETEE
ncbi:MAG: serine hydrolase, partial [Ferruginibacter sp.]